MNYKATILLFVLVAAVSCGQRRPGISRKEAVRELLSLQAARDSITRKASAGLDTFAKDYVPQAGVKYEPVIRTDNVKVLDIKAALADSRELQPDAFGHVSLYPVGYGINLSRSLIPVNGGDAWIMACLQEILLLDSQMKYMKTLFENDVDVETVTDTEKGLSYFTVKTRRYIRDLAFRGDSYEKICAYCVGQSELSAVAVLPFADLVMSERPWTPDDIVSMLPVASISEFAVYGEGFLAVEPFSSRFGIYSARGDTLCRFTVNDAPDYVPKNAYRMGETGNVYRVGEKTMVRIAYDNTVYEVEDASTLNAVYRFDFGDLKRPDGKYVVESTDNSLAGYYLIKNLIETDRYLFLQVDEGYDSPNNREKGEVGFHFLVYDKRSGDFYSVDRKHLRDSGGGLYVPVIPYLVGSDTLSLRTMDVADGRLYTFVPVGALKKNLSDTAMFAGMDDDESVIIMTDKQ